MKSAFSIATVCVFFAVLLTGFGLFLGGHLIRIGDIKMEPTLLRGDVVWAQKIFAPENYVPARGSLVSFYRKGRIHVRRVIGRPGDRLRIEQGTIDLNGQQATLRPEKDAWFDLRPLLSQSTITQIYSERVGADEHPVALMAESFIQSPLDHWPTTGGYFTVPDDHVFVLSDSRNLADDSRVFGALPIKAIRSQIRILAFSHDPEQVARIRVSRLLELF